MRPSATYFSQRCTRVPAVLAAAPTQAYSRGLGRDVGRAKTPQYRQTPYRPVLVVRHAAFLETLLELWLDFVPQQRQQAARIGRFQVPAAVAAGYPGMGDDVQALSRARTRDV